MQFVRKVTDWCSDVNISTKTRCHLVQDIQVRILWVTLIQIVTSPFNLEVNSCSFESREIKYFLLISGSVSNIFDIPTLDYVNASAQMQWQNAMRPCRFRWLSGLRIKFLAGCFLGSRERILIESWLYNFCVCCVSFR